MTPVTGTRPCVPLNPTTPQYAAGRSTEPTVCEPSASGVIRAATAAAEPADEPPGVWPWFHGFRVGAGSRYANSVVTVFPSTIAPAARMLATDAASAPGRVWGKEFAPRWPGIPETSGCSF